MRNIIRTGVLRACMTRKGIRSSFGNRNYRGGGVPSALEHLSLFCGPSGPRTSLMREQILSAIDGDKCARVRRLLQVDSSLVALQISKARLYEKEIVHWLYAGDTPLHLAAAGYRVEIVRLLLAAGADPNAMMNHRASGPLHYAADTCLT